jgi:uncharacterized protein DUF4304
VIDAVSSGIAGWFRQREFRRTGRCFFRVEAEVFHTANLQASKLNASAAATFAVNLGVEWPLWHGIWTSQAVGSNPALAPTFVQTRLHPTDGVGRDYWWETNDLGAAKQPTSEVTTPLEAHADEFWRHYGDLAAVPGDFEARVRVPNWHPGPACPCSVAGAGRPPGRGSIRHR